MSEYYTAKRSRNLYDPASQRPFKISRSKIDLFLECPRCFYLDRRLGVGRPPGYPFALNSAVDALLKREFDMHRRNETVHPLLKQYKVDAKPVAHKNLDEWRENFKGVQFLHESTNLIITGAIDDLWQNSDGEYLVVDYKSTSKSEPITALNKDWQDSYKRQLEVYQWLLRQNELLVSNTGYFVYCNGDADRDSFDAKLEFDITLIPYEGDDGWVEETIAEIYQILQKDEIPAAASGCDYCAYRDAVGEVVADKNQDNQQ